jgi:hypothetical protein
LTLHREGLNPEVRHAHTGEPGGDAPAGQSAGGILRRER